MTLRIEDALGEGELLDSLTAYGVKDVEQLAKMFKDTKTSMDSSIRVPGQNATVEELESYYKKIGRPESPDHYTIPVEVEGTALQQTLAELRGAAHKAGLTPDQWMEMANVAGNRATTEKGQITELKEAWSKQAEEQFGDKLPDVRTAKDQIISDLSQGDEQLQVLLSEVGEHPRVMEALTKVAEITSADTAPNMTMEGNKAAMDPLEEAREAADQLREIHSSDAYKQRHHPEHEIAMDKFYRLSAKIEKAGFQGATDPRLARDWFASPK